MSVAIPRCRFCRRTTGKLVEDPALGATRTRRTSKGPRVDRRQTWHHPSCLFDAAGVTEMPYPGKGELETGRLRRKAAARA